MAKFKAGDLVMLADKNDIFHSLSRSKMKIFKVIKIIPMKLGPMPTPALILATDLKGHENTTWSPDRFKFVDPSFFTKFQLTIWGFE